MIIKKKFVSAVVLVAALPAFSGDVFHVSVTGSDETGDGSAESPFGSVEYAVGQVGANGTEIIIADGTYLLEDTVSVTSARYHQDLVIRSASGDRDAVILDGQGKIRCLSIQSATRTVVSGLTIRNGYLEPENSTSHQDCAGAGIFCHNSDATITNCVIADCHVNATDCTVWGGGVHLQNGKPLLVDSVIKNCTASNHFSATARSVQGGGACFWNANARNSVIRDCIVWSDRADKAGVTVCSGGGALARNSSLVENCRIYGNRAENPSRANENYLGTGGGVYVMFGAVLKDCLVTGNTAAAMGGGVLVAENFRITGCTVSNNTVTADYNTAGYVGSGGGIYVSNSARNDGDKIIEKCLIASNSNMSTVAGSPLGGGIMVDGCFDLELFDCVIEENSAISGGALGVARRFGTQFNTGILVSNCLFRSNFSEKTGGALTVIASDDLEFRDCWFIGNENRVNYGCLAHISGSYDRPEGTVFRNCLFRNNVSRSGNTVVSYTCDKTYPLSFEFCTFVSNRADVAVVYPVSAASAAQCFVKGCVFAEDMERKDMQGYHYPVFGGNFADCGANITCSWSNCADNYPAGENGNLPVAGDPCFTDPSVGNYRPLLGSPLKAAGGAAEDWMQGAKDLGQGDPVVEQVGDYGVSVVRVRPKSRLYNGAPTIGCSEAWQPLGLRFKIR